MFGPSSHSGLSLRNVSRASGITIFANTRKVTGNLSTILSTTTILGTGRQASVILTFVKSNGVGPRLVRQTQGRRLSGYHFCGPVPGGRLGGIITSTSLNLVMLTSIPTFCCKASPGGFFSCVSSKLTILGGCPN